MLHLTPLKIGHLQMAKSGSTENEILALRWYISKSFYWIWEV